MTNHYLLAFEQALGTLPEAQRIEVVGFYSEYILDAGLLDDAAITAKLGTPQELAKQTLADYAIEQSAEPHAKHQLRTVWLIIIALFASPIALPLAAAAVLLLVACTLAILGVIVALAALLIVLTGAGLASLISGLVVSSQSLATGALFAGIGLIALGVAYLLAPLIITGSTRLLALSARGAARLYRRLFKNRLEA